MHVLDGGVEGVSGELRVLVADGRAAEVGVHAVGAELGEGGLGEGGGVDDGVVGAGEEGLRAGDGARGDVGVGVCRRGATMALSIENWGGSFDSISSCGQLEPADLIRL